MKVNWSIIDSSKMAAVEYAICDLNLFLKEVVNHYQGKKIYFWNPGYKYLAEYGQEKLSILEDNAITSLGNALDVISTLEGIAVFEGIREFEEDLEVFYRLKNLLFGLKQNIRILFVGEQVLIPHSFNTLIPKIKIALPNVIEIRDFLQSDAQIDPNDLVGFSYGEINLLRERNLSSDEILDLKTSKLTAKGLSITPNPDVDTVGGLDLLLRDLNKIKKLFLPGAAERGLRPPKGCLLWGLPGTGKSLTAKMLSQILRVPLISCNWNQLVSTNLAESLQNIDLVFQLVDSIGSCVVFFDEFEKAFFGWNSSEGGGVMAKMAGYLLSWLQDHESQSIMVATINRIDMLPPELIRRFEYIWFFDLNLHNGAMYEIFSIHLRKHFQELVEKLSDDNWYKIFSSYRSCSPAEIAGAVRRSHDEIFYRDLHLELDENILMDFLIAERKNFKPAASDRKISDQLAKIRRTADFARPVQGKDCTRFATPPVKLFASNRSQLPEDYSLAI